MVEVATPPDKGRLKKFLLIALSLIVVAGIAFATISILNSIVPKNQDHANTLTPQQQAAEQAKKNMKAANSSESNGETATAIASYKEALKSYQAAGDKAGEEGVKLKLQYLESLPQGN